jgi:hypothetical protein
MAARAPSLPTTRVAVVEDDSNLRRTIVAFINRSPGLNGAAAVNGVIGATNAVGGAQNWKLQNGGTTTEFLNGDFVVFDDSPAGSTSVVISDANVLPNNATFNNSSKNYTVSGNYGIAGGGSLTVAGGGSVTLTTSNSYSGGLDDHVPYAIEAYPEGGQGHLSSESGLYCRIFTEGMFGILPTGLDRFQCTPRLPAGWASMALRHVKAVRGDFDVVVEKSTMKHTLKSVSGYVAALLCAGRACSLAGSLEEDFKNPPLAAGPYVWWHWMGSNISREGIAKDLEAMQASGIGGATIFNLTSAVQEGAKPTRNLPFPDITYRSTKWWEMVQFAASEAQRLGLERGMHNCVGYSATGRPWVTPELSMQRVTFSVTQVKGPAPFAGVLPRPGVGRDFYRGIAVLAVPDTDTVDPLAILDLSAQMDNTGRLTWSAPAGAWNLYRIGRTSTGSGPHPMPEDVQALEVDKMSASASKFHFEQVINPLREQLGTMLGKSFRHLTLDSYEAGSQNWTPGFREEFRKRKGYDPVPWLPLLDTKSVGEGKKRMSVPKHVLGSSEQGARFRWDLNDMIAQLYQQNNLEQGTRMMHAAGLMMQFEPYSGPFDTIAGAAIADVPMGEF